jgi:toxin-antitoxin system PIN domain toxin
VIVDANVLIYAVDRTSPFHTSAATWLTAALNGPTRTGLPWPTLTAFQRIATNPRAAANPLTPKAAWEHIEAWLAAPAAWIPVPGPRHAEVLGELIAAGDLRGNLVADAHLAALAIEHGVPICSYDSDFARFPHHPRFSPPPRPPPIRGAGMSPFLFCARWRRSGRQHQRT